MRPLTAVIDIGSNSVRLVVFTGSGRMPVPVFNERTLCGLGRTLGATGRLDPKGIEPALAHLARFAVLARAMKVERLEALATEAVRAASDGADFVAKAEAVLGTKITILDGDSEAAASALGVVSGIPGADGVMGDLGGGSLEVVALENGAPGARATLPIGALRLEEAAGSDIKRAQKIIDEAIVGVEWLKDMKGRNFYPVGGAWRAFAAVHMEQEQYPLHVIHQYTMSRDDALGLLGIVAQMSPKSIARMRLVPKARRATLPVAAMVMERLIEVARPGNIVFSAYGLREGWLYGQLSEADRDRDPLLAGVAEFAQDYSRFGVPGEALERWIEPLFPQESERLKRLRRAAVLLSDIGWRDHPDYRARDTFSRVLHLPITGISHDERVILAFAVSGSYGGGHAGPVRNLVRHLVSGADRDHAIAIGRALRFARALSGGVTEILRMTRLELDDKAVLLHLPADMSHLMSDSATARLAILAHGLGRKARVIA